MKHLLSRPLVVDCLLVLAVLALHTPLMFLNDSKLRPLSWQVLLEVVAALSLLLRRRYPAVVFAVVLEVMVVQASLGDPHNGNILAMLVALYSLSTRVAVWLAVLATVLVLWAGIFVPGVPDRTVDVGFWLSSWITLFCVTSALGQAQRRSRRRRERLEQTLGMLDEAHKRLAEEAVMGERNRIAREMHDIVAHGLSLIAVQSGVARALLTSNPQQVAESVGIIERTSRESLAEMRSMLGVLRQSDEDGGEPQPGLGRIPELLARARESGLDLEVLRDGDPPDLPPGQALVAYRLVQEALTNVLKHAGPVRTQVSFVCRPDRLVMDVFNESPSVVPVGVVSGGHGLVGMRERVGMYGGVVSARHVDGGYRVTAELPVEAR
ncbi:histidine kinase [Lentzea sp. NPDC051838]|uniref:sensor histidine kinase n=1 Tax=Lentzea sp. NPDC051838 TaxID=3154849 RepID=UPI0034216B72